MAEVPLKDTCLGSTSSWHARVHAAYLDGQTTLLTQCAICRKSPRRDSALGSPSTPQRQQERNLADHPRVLDSRHVCKRTSTAGTEARKKIDETAERPFYHPREIWWCTVGVNVGNELDGTGQHHDRPVLIIRPFNAETFFGVALIGHPRTGRYYFPRARSNAF